MSRRNRTSPFEDLIKVASKAPWWVGVLSAIVAYLALHHIATMTFASPVNLPELGSVAGKSMFKATAIYLQYLLPFALLLGSAISLLNDRRRKVLAGALLAPVSRNPLADVSWQDFEILIGEVFRRAGFVVTEMGGTQADGGVDLVLRKDGEKHLVQCKHWRAQRVGVQIVRELYGVMAATGAASGFVVTSGHFTNEAKSFAAGRNVELVDGEELAKLSDLLATQTERSCRSVPSETPEEASSSRNPACPSCGAPMVARIARHGTNAGSEFWGCTAFPKCKGTRPVV
jgi:restriction system protein